MLINQQLSSSSTAQVKMYEIILHNDGPHSRYKGQTRIYVKTMLQETLAKSH